MPDHDAIYADLVNAGELTPRPDLDHAADREQTYRKLRILFAREGQPPEKAERFANQLANAGARRRSASTPTFQNPYETPGTREYEQVQNESAERKILDSYSPGLSRGVAEVTRPLAHAAVGAWSQVAAGGAEWVGADETADDIRAFTADNADAAGTYHGPVAEIAKAAGGTLAAAGLLRRLSGGLTGAAKLGGVTASKAAALGTAGASAAYGAAAAMDTLSVADQDLGYWEKAAIAAPAGAMSAIAEKIAPGAAQSTLRAVASKGPQLNTKLGDVVHSAVRGGAEELGYEVAGGVSLFGGGVVLGNEAVKDAGVAQLEGAPMSAAFGGTIGFAPGQYRGAVDNRRAYETKQAVAAEAAQNAQAAETAAAAQAANFGVPLDPPPVDSGMMAEAERQAAIEANSNMPLDPPPETPEMQAYFEQAAAVEANSNMPLLPPLTPEEQAFNQSPEAMAFRDHGLPVDPPAPQPWQDLEATQIKVAKVSSKAKAFADSEKAKAELAAAHAKTEPAPGVPATKPEVPPVPVETEDRMSEGIADPEHIRLIDAAQDAGKMKTAIALRQRAVEAAKTPVKGAAPAAAPVVSPETKARRAHHLQAEMDRREAVGNEASLTAEEIAQITAKADADTTILVAKPIRRVQSVDPETEKLAAEEAAQNSRTEGAEVGGTLEVMGTNYHGEKAATIIGKAKAGTSRGEVDYRVVRLPDSKELAVVAHTSVQPTLADGSKGPRTSAWKLVNSDGTVTTRSGKSTPEERAQQIIVPDTPAEAAKLQKWLDNSTGVKGLTAFKKKAGGAGDDTVAEAMAKAKASGGNAGLSVDAVPASQQAVQAVTKGMQNANKTGNITRRLEALTELEASISEAENLSGVRAITDALANIAKKKGATLPEDFAEQRRSSPVEALDLLREALADHVLDQRASIKGVKENAAAPADASAGPGEQVYNPDTAESDTLNAIGSRGRSRPEVRAAMVNQYPEEAQALGAKLKREPAEVQLAASQAWADGKIEELKQAGLIEITGEGDMTEIRTSQAAKTKHDEDFGGSKLTRIDPETHTKTETLSKPQKMLTRIAERLGKTMGTTVTVDFYDAGKATPWVRFKPDGTVTMALSTGSAGVHGDFAHEMVHVAARQLPPKQREQFYGDIEQALDGAAPALLADIRKQWGEDANHREELLAEAARWAAKRDPAFMESVAGEQPTWVSKLAALIRRMAERLGALPKQADTDLVIRRLFAEAQALEASMPANEDLADAAGAIVEPDAKKRQTLAARILRSWMDSGDKNRTAFKAGNAAQSLARGQMLSMQYPEMRDIHRLSGEQLHTAAEIASEHAPTVQALKDLPADRQKAVTRALIHFRANATPTADFGAAFQWKDPKTKMPVSIKLTADEVKVVKQVHDMGKALLERSRESIMSLAGLDPDKPSEIPENMKGLAKYVEGLQKLETTNYFPFMRDGNFLVTYPDGTTLAFDSNSKAAAEVTANPGATLRDLGATKDYEGLGISAEAIAALGARAGLTEAQVKEFLSPTVRATLAAGKGGGRFTKAKLAAGASEEGVKVLQKYLGEMSHFISASQHAARIDQAAENAKKAATKSGDQGLQNAIRLWAKDRGTTMASGVRAWRMGISTVALGGRLPTAVANAASNYITTPATIGAIAIESGSGYQQALAHMKRSAGAHAKAALQPFALASQLIPESVTGEKRTAMVKAANGGQFGGTGGDEAFARETPATKAAKLLLLPHHRMEVGNRMAAWSTGYEMAVEQVKNPKFWSAIEDRGYSGDKSPASVGTFFNEMVNIHQGRGMDSAFGRTKLGGMVTPLLNYSIDMIQQEAQLLARAVEQGRENPRVLVAEALRLTALSAALGVRGVPIAGKVYLLAQGIMWAFAKATGGEEEEERLLTEESGKGWMGAIRKAVVVAARAPGLSEATRENMRDMAKRLEEGAGLRIPDSIPPAIGLFTNAYEAQANGRAKLAAGDTRGAVTDFASAMPAIKDLNTWMNPRGGETKYGKTTTAAGSTGVAQAAGVRSEDQRLGAEMRKVANERRAEQDEALKAIANLFVDKDQMKAMKLLKDHNAAMMKKKNYGAVITGQRLRQAIVGETLDRAGVFSKEWLKVGGKAGAYDRMRLQKEAEQVREEQE